LPLEILLTAAIGLGIIVFAPIIGPALLAVFGAAVVASLVGLSWYFFMQQNLLIDFTFPLLSCLLIFGVLVFSKYVSEQAQRRRIRSAFSQYMSPALVEQLAQSPEKLVLGGEQRQMTIMFSDVRGFTTISELYKDDPQGLTTLMNRLLTPLTNAIIESKGTIDKYIGDAIMAFWNAPLADSSHEINACKAALDMQRRLILLNEEREREAKESGEAFVPLQVGIGVNTGSCVVGNMGSNLRFDYSVLGDSVNLASRLEGQTRVYGVPIILGQKTAQSAKDGGFALVEIDQIAVKGKTQPETAFALLGDNELAAAKEFGALRDMTSNVLALYRAQDWDGAADGLDKVRAIDTGNRLDFLFDLYTKRIDTFRKEPPPPGWNGVFVSQTK
jgi:adenylate cyclase